MLLAVCATARTISGHGRFSFGSRNFLSTPPTTGVSFIGELPTGYAEVPLSGSDDARGGRTAKFMIVFASIL
jgi:hypothetical protein